MGNINKNDNSFKMKRKLKIVAEFLFFVFALYFVVACGVFALRHPWMTDIQRFMHIYDALIWKQVDKKSD